ncbi:MAG: hypothetical protein GX539_09430, partial [Candidatus Cloacimonetes bacterium]|nr:hypothetical protein [Candidatus Cloacimonadota bacterium]
MHVHRRSTVAALFILFASVTAAHAQRPSADALKREVTEEVAGMQKLS